MNFTREPIIETVITPREGCKLVVRSSKGNGQEDYFVDAVEVVSFGHSFFFRSLERPKSFLVPVSDYEILELKETRMVLKNISPERSIKIGGGREAQVRPPREETQQPAAPLPQPQEKNDRNRRDKRGRRRGRGRDRQESLPPQEFQEQPQEELPVGIPSEEPIAEAPAKAPSFISKLFPPPPTLIKESLHRYKPAEPSGEDPFSQETEQKASFEEEFPDIQNQDEEPPEE